MIRLLMPILLAAAFVAAASAATEPTAVTFEPWPALIERVKGDPAARDTVGAVLDRARELLAKRDGPHVRPTRIDQIKHPGSTLPDPVQREVQSLSLYDANFNKQLAGELAVLATAYRLTGEEAFADRVRAQLAEMTTWSPLQRGGWSSGSITGDWRTNPRFGGSWLGTGGGVRAIADTFDIMPPESIPDELRRKLHALLEKEIEQVVEDWRVKRQWFVRGNNAITNQWVMPTEGLIRACLVLGVERHREAYELGIRNVMQTLDAQNDDGSYAEGWFYAKYWTVPSLLTTGRILALHGDRRVIDHPFLRKFPRWFATSFQPGRQFVQAFDCIGATRDSYDEMRSLLTQLAACTQDRVARWLLAHQVGSPSVDHWALVAAALPPVPREEAPPTRAIFAGAHALTWRSSWDDAADGVWIRGGHPRDQHDHTDRGHVSYTHRGRPILIECGTPYYQHPACTSHFQSTPGHNVLQLGDGPLPEPFNQGHHGFKLPRGWQGRRVVATIKADRFDDDGGEAGLTVRKGYPDLERWERRVAWDRTRMTVTDTVKLKQPQVVLFRWHLGTAEEATLADATVTWPEAALAVEADQPLALRQIRSQDHVFERKNDRHEHACIVVRTKEQVASVAITTTITPKEPR